MLREALGFTHDIKGQAVRITTAFLLHDSENPPGVLRCEFIFKVAHYRKHLRKRTRKEIEKGRKAARNYTLAMGRVLPYVATMTTHTHAPLTIQQAIERACHDIEQGEHGPTPHAIQSPIDLRDAMRAALARLSAGTDKLTS